MNLASLTIDPNGKFSQPPLGHAAQNEGARKMCSLVALADAHLSPSRTVALAAFSGFGPHQERELEIEYESIVLWRELAESTRRSDEMGYLDFRDGSVLLDVQEDLPHSLVGDRIGPRPVIGRCNWRRRWFRSRFGAWSRQHAFGGHREPGVRRGALHLLDLVRVMYFDPDTFVGWAFEATEDLRHDRRRRED